jgi:UDP-N-acetylmuramate dehydrogenase
MTLREHVPLSALTTFRIGGPARFVYECGSIESLKTAAAHARSRGLRCYPLGQGSNLLASDSAIEAVIAVMRIDGIEFMEEENGATLATVGAGVSWDAFVRACAQRTLWGVENLAGIPGTVGAAPVQNVGAYGADISDTLAWVECFDLETDTVVRIESIDCALGYRDSRFKRESNLVITRAAFHLATQGTPKVMYPDLVTLSEAGAPLTTPHEIGEAVRSIRSKKFPDLAKFGTAGSFFKNPTITQAAYDALRIQYPELPGFSVREGNIKIPLAWILDKVLGLRGFRMSHAWLFEAQPLVLVTEDNATAADVDVLAAEVTERVHAATGITIEREVRSLV